jgi:hypothetical protein
MNQLVPLLLHTLVVVILVGAYVALTVTGNDGSAILGVLIGYLGGAGTATVITRAEKTG